MAALAEANQALASTYGVGWLGGNPEDEPGGTQDLNPETDPDEDGDGRVDIATALPLAEV